MDTLAVMDWMRWIGVSGLLMLFLAMVFVAWWALFADRSKGRRRCPQCWYDLAYSPGMTCSECGFVGTSEEDFTRTRRRGGPAVIAVIACGVLGAYAIDRANDQGWMNYLPTRCLLWIMPLGDGVAQLVSDEMTMRSRNNELSDEQWLTVVQRCVNGDSVAEPPTDAWITRYGNLLILSSRTLQRANDDELREQTEALLMQLPLRVDLETRSTWPAGVEPTIDVLVQDWWPNEVQARIVAQPDLPEAEPNTQVRWNGPIQARSYSLNLPAMDEGEHEITFDFTYHQRPDENSPWQDAGTQQVMLPISVSGEMEETLTPVSSDEHDQAMRDAMIEGGLVKYQSGSLPVRVGINYQITYQELFNDTALGIRIEVMRNGQVGRYLDIWWVGGLDVADRQLAWEVPFLDDDLLVAPDQPDDEWTVRVHSMPELALRVAGTEVSKYWVGDVIAPVSVRTVGGEAPSRGWVPQSLSIYPEGEEEESAEETP